MKKIIVAIDGSSHSTKAVEKTRELAKAFDSQVVIVHAVNAFHHYITANETMIIREIEEVESVKENAKKLLERTKESFKDLNKEVETVLLEGDPPHELIEYIDSSDADLIILGSHGVKGLRRFMLGSVVSKIVHHVDRSVLITR